MKKLILVISIISLMISSCKKEVDSISTKQYDSPQSIMSPTAISQYGISHNLKMDYIAAEPDFINKSLEEVYLYGNNYSDEYFESIIDQDYQAHEIRRLLCFSLIEKPSTAGQELFDNGLIPATIIGLVDSLSDILDKAADYYGQTYKSSSEFNAEIESFEQYINENYTVVYDDESKVGNEYAFLLCACSIAKNSYDYWLDAATNSTNPWSDKLDQVTYNGGITEAKVPDWLKKVWHGVKVAAVDTWGLFTSQDAYQHYSDGSSTYNFNKAWQYAGEQSSTVP